MEMYAQDVVQIVKHIVDKYNDKQHDTKYKFDEDPVCNEPFPDCYVVNLKELNVDLRVKHIYDRGLSHDIMQEILQCSGPGSVEIVQFGATLLASGAQPGYIHADYGAPLIEADGMFKNIS